MIFHSIFHFIPDKSIPADIDISLVEEKADPENKFLRYLPEYIVSLTSLRLSPTSLNLKVGYIVLFVKICIHRMIYVTDIYN